MGVILLANFREFFPCGVFGIFKHFTNTFQRFAALSMGRDWSLSQSPSRQHVVPECGTVWSLVHQAPYISTLREYPH